MVSQRPEVTSLEQEGASRQASRWTRYGRWERPIAASLPPALRLQRPRLLLDWKRGVCSGTR